MIDLRDKETGKVTRHYVCTAQACMELCLANIECLLHIALADSDEHIRQLGGERELLVLINGYMDLITRIEKICLNHQENIKGREPE